MYDKGRKKGTVRFSVKPLGGAKKVSIAGDFNDWQPAPLRKSKDEFALTLPVAGGTHEYKFLVDGQWIVDPDNSAWALNPYGTLNSVAQID